MAIFLVVNDISYEIGSQDFLGSFFDTIEIRLTKGENAKKYPTILHGFYNGCLKYESLCDAEKELQEIHSRLKDFPCSEVVWDKYNLKKIPPWGDNVSADITDLSNYYITSNGEDLFTVIFRAIDIAKSEKAAIKII